MSIVSVNNQTETEPAANTVKAGLLAAWPICLGYLPIGLSFGILAHQNGLTAWQVGLMSLLVFAGGSQFIAVAMLTVGASAVTIVATTFMVNLRHLLMSSALSAHLPGVSRRFLALFAYGITDESFAVNLVRFREQDWNRFSALILNHAANAVWILSTIAGALVGQFIPVGAMGMEYALTAMFICLLVFQLRSRIFVMTALAAAGCALPLYLWLPGNTYILVAACCAASVGFWLRRYARRQEASL